MTTLSTMVAAAMAQQDLDPDVLRSAEVTAVDVLLTLKSGEVIRVEISSLPALVVEASGRPETTQQADPEPARAEKAPAGRGSAAEQTGKRPRRRRKS
jgi:hypothetical protein